MCPSGSTAVLRCQIDQRVAGLSQLANGNSPSLSDELSNRVQLCWSNGDKLSSVIDHTCGKQSVRPEEPNVFLTFTRNLLLFHTFKDIFHILRFGEKLQINFSSSWFNSVPTIFPFGRIKLKKQFYLVIAGVRFCATHLVIKQGCTWVITHGKMHLGQRSVQMKSMYDVFGSGRAPYVLQRVMLFLVKYYNHSRCCSVSIKFLIIARSRQPVRQPSPNSFCSLSIASCVLIPK